MKIDSCILNLVPRGTYYNTLAEQLKSAVSQHQTLFQGDRVLYSLLLTLPATSFSKAIIIRNLLRRIDKKFNGENITISENALVKWNSEYEYRLMLWALRQETVPHALKALLMFTDKTMGRLNNARTKRLIMEYIFGSKSPEWLAVKYKKKLQFLIRHALGIKNIQNILDGTKIGNKFFRKYIGRYSANGKRIFHFLFNKKIELENENDLLNQYCQARQAASRRGLSEFLTKKSGLPFEVLMGLRNHFKDPVKKEILLTSSQLSEKQKLQMQSFAEREGVGVKVDFFKQSLLDLWRYFYSQNGSVPNSWKEAVEKIAVQYQINYDFGKTVLILDASDSMKGSETRKLHPFLVGMSIASIFKDAIKIMVNGETNPSLGLMPAGATNLAQALIQAAEHRPDTVIIVSDGYENQPAGGFNATLKQLRQLGYDFNAIHLNPVFAAEDGKCKILSDEIFTFPVQDTGSVKTAIAFQAITANPEGAKKLLASFMPPLLFTTGR